MDHQSSHITDIGCNLYIFQMIDQLIRPFFGTCTDSQNRSALSTKLFFCQFMIWTGLQQRIVDRYTFQLLQCLGKPESVITCLLYTSDAADE